MPAPLRSRLAFSSRLARSSATPPPTLNDWRPAEVTIVGPPGMPAVWLAVMVARRSSVAYSTAYRPSTASV